jgi:pantoate--beta-alanine ligase
MPAPRVPSPVLIEQADALAEFRGSAFVPTMGALHDGHAALLRQAKASGLRTCLSIFVNPTQFGPNEDLARYPRTLDADLALAAREGVEAVFLPSVETMYPEGIVVAQRQAAEERLPEVATRPGLEDRCRPGHLAGVQLVVGRLFDAVQPALAIFGEKDWQQLKLVEAMVRERPGRWPGLTIRAAPTVRESDGLALSSRNRYLRPADRERAAGIPRAMRIAHTAQRPATAERLMLETLESHGFEVDYAAVRDAETLLPVEGFERPTRALIAARLRWTDADGPGSVRLIDNAAMTVWR